MSRFRIPPLLAGAVAFAALTGVSAAQEGGDSAEKAKAKDVIVVTAAKRTQTLQEVPFSVNAQTETDIQRTGSQNLEDLSRNVAGLTIQNLGPGQSQVAIRGVSAGQIVRDQPGVKEQVGVYLDETVISLSLFTPDLDLFDLNRVETLRGPQGTLFGAGSIGGTIRFITNQPVLGEFNGMAEGSFNVIDGGGPGGHIKGVVNIPVGDKIAIRAVGYHTEYGGFIDALREGGGVDKNVNSGRRSGGRIAIKFEPTDNITITPRVLYQDIGTDGFNREEVFNLFANPYTTTRTPIQLQDRQQYLLLNEKFNDKLLIADLKLEAGLGFADFTSVTSYTHRNLLVSRDASALTGSVSVDLSFPDAGVLLPSNLVDRTKVKQITQEARLTSNGEGPLEWLVGVFYTDIKRNYSQRLPTPGYDAYTDARYYNGFSASVANGYGPDSPYNSDLPYDDSQLAFFGEGTYHLTDALRFTAGGRYYKFDESRTFTSGGLFSNDDNVENKTSSSGFTPRFIASYDVDDGVTVNAQVSQGFRLGGVNDPLNKTLCTAKDEAIFGSFQTYDDETLWNYEGGVKVTRGNFTANVAGFYADMKDLQVTLDAGSCSSRISFNVPKAHSVGAEFEFGLEPAEGLSLTVAGSYVQSRFDSTVRDGDGNVLGGVRKGNRLASVPEFQIAATATYNFDLDLFGTSRKSYVAASIQHVGSRYTQPGDQEPRFHDFVSGLPFGGATGHEVTRLDLQLPPYEILNLNAGIDFEDWELILFVNNVTDENALLSFDRERGGRARLGFRVNQPRTFGVTARVHF